MTTNPATVLGISDRVGAIKTGLDADLVIWSGDPLESDSRVLRVLIDGKTVYEWDGEFGRPIIAERFARR
jgi:imidazolonepropionase-like amidohydrolase